MERWSFEWFKHILWSEEAAGWLQAIFALVGILYAYQKGAAAYRRDFLERETRRASRARTLALRLLDPLARWRKSVEEVVSRTTSSLEAMAKAALVGRNIAVPPEIERSLSDISEVFDEAGRAIEEAVYIVGLVQAKERTATFRQDALTGDMIRNPLDVDREFLERLHDLYSLLLDAEQGLHEYFQPD